MTEAPTKTAPRARARRPRRTIDAKLRARIERAVERMIAALDVLDAPDEDREEDDPAEDNGDAEPSLGSQQATPSPCAFGYGGYSSQGHQLNWADGGRDDREYDGDDLEEDYRWHEPA